MHGRAHAGRERGAQRVALAEPVELLEPAGGAGGGEELVGQLELAATRAAGKGLPADDARACASSTTGWKPASTAPSARMSASSVRALRERPRVGVVGAAPVTSISVPIARACEEVLSPLERRVPCSGGFPAPSEKTAQIGASRSHGVQTPPNASWRRSAPWPDGVISGFGPAHGRALKLGARSQRRRRTRARLHARRRGSVARQSTGPATSVWLPSGRPSTSCAARARRRAARSRSTPVSMPISWSIETRSSVAMLPVAPAGTGQPPSSPKLDSKLLARRPPAPPARSRGPGRACCGSARSARRRRRAARAPAAKNARTWRGLAIPVVSPKPISCAPASRRPLGDLEHALRLGTSPS